MAHVTSTFQQALQTAHEQLSRAEDLASAAGYKVRLLLLETSLV